MKLWGYDLDEIEQISKELRSVLDDLGLDADPRLAVLGLCRAIVDTAAGDDLDLACRMIDDLSNIVNGGEDEETL